MPERQWIPAVAYLRMSGKKQDTSIEQQREQIEKWATERGYRIIRWYIDEGKSGSKATEKRVAFLGMIHDAEAVGDFEVILCLDNSRFGRLDTYEGAIYKLRLRDCGVSLDTVLDGPSDWESEAGQIIDTVHTVKNSAYSRLLGQKSLKGRIEATKKGKPTGGRPPYGMKRLVTDDEGGQHTIDRASSFQTPPRWQVTYIPGDHDEIKIVRWLHQQYLKRDVSFRWLAWELNKRGVPGPLGGGWRGATVRQILTNRVYVGCCVIGKRVAKGSFHKATPDGPEPIRGKQRKYEDRPPEEHTVAEGAFKPIIPRKWFRAVQEKIVRNERHGWKPQHDAGHPLTGILRCGHCGGRMNARKKPSGTIYLCETACRYPGSECGLWQVREDEILPFLLERLREGMDNEALEGLRAQQVEPPQVDQSGLEKKLRTVEKAIERGTRRLCSVDDSLVPAVQTELKRLQAEKDALMEQMKGSKGFDMDEWRERWFEWWHSIRDRLVWIDKDIQVKGQMVKMTMPTLDGDETEVEFWAGETVDDCSVPVEPVVIRETLKAMNTRVDLWWRDKPQGKGYGRGRWELDRGRIRVEMDEFTVNASPRRKAHMCRLHTTMSPRRSLAPSEAPMCGQKSSRA